VTATLARFAVRRRRAVVLASLLVTLASLTSLTRLRLDIDLLEMLPAGRPVFDEYRAVLDTFGATQTVVVLVDGARGAALADALDLLAAGYRRLPEARAVSAGRTDDAGAPFLDPAHAAAWVPDDRLDDLRARLAPAAIAAAVARARRLLALPGSGELASRLGRDPLGLSAVAGDALRDGYADPAVAAAEPRLLTPEGDAGLILVHPAGSPFDAAFTTRLFAAMAGVETDPRLGGVRVRHGGSYAHAREDAALIQTDVLRYTLLALAAVVLIFQLGFRDVRILPIVCYLLIAGSLPVFAASLLIYERLNALSLSFAAIFYGLAIDAGIHFYARLLGERRQAPLEEAVVRTCAGIGGALIVASLTTAAAFAVVAWSAIAAVSQIGVLTALGMLVNAVHALVLLPALAATWPGRLAREPPARPELPWLGHVAGGAARHRRAVVAGAVLIVALWVAGAARVPVDAEMLHLQPADSTAAAVERELGARFGALAPHAAVVVTAPDLERALAREERVVAWLDRRAAEGASDVRGHQALSTFLPSRATEARRRDAFAALPRADARAALVRALAAEGFRVAAFAPALDALVAADTRLPREPTAPWLAPLAERHLRRDPGGVRLALFLEVAPDADLAALRARLRDELGSDLVVTGRRLMQQALAGVIAGEVRWFTVLAGVLNLLIVLAQTRSLPLAAAIVAPTLVALAALLEIMARTGLAFTPVTLMVLPLAFGIGVDDCVYLGERVRAGATPGAAATLVGRALLLTSLTTMAGFGFLGVSRYPALAGLGGQAVLAIALAFVGAVVVLPALLASLAGRVRRQSP